jgi:hypothetical protein
MMPQDTRDSTTGRFKPGTSASPQTQFKPGIRPSPRTEFKPGVRTSPATEFKKGAPRVTLPVGSETIRTHKGGVRRGWIKVAEPNLWIPRANHVWTTAHGPLPKGLVIHHIDHNPLNDSLDNLIALTRAAHAMEHRATLSVAAAAVAKAGGGRWKKVRNAGG